MEFFNAGGCSLLYFCIHKSIVYVAGVPPDTVVSF